LNQAEKMKSEKNDASTPPENESDSFSEPPILSWKPLLPLDIDGGLKPPEASPHILSNSARWKILFYLSGLIFLIGLGSPFGSLIDIPVSFFLKNRLSLEAQESAEFRFIVAIPLFLSYVFGFIRDRKNPFGMNDRGFIILYGAITAGIYILFAFIPFSYFTILMTILLSTTSFLFVLSAQQGLTSLIGQQHVMSGQISTVLNILTIVPMLIGLLIGGWLSGLLESIHADDAVRILFLMGGIIMTIVAFYGFWKPKVVFDNVQYGHENILSPTEDLKRLLNHWPIYPSLLIWFLWNFSPGISTPLQYYLQNVLHAEDAQWGQWNAIFAASFIPTMLLYGFLCRKYALKNLLIWGTLAAIPQMIPLLFVNSLNAAMLTAIPMGLMGGVASASYIDLIIRSSPMGLQGTTLMLSGGLYYIAMRFGDLMGSYLYDNYGGFTVDVIATTVVYALILPLLLSVPRYLTATADGEVSKENS
jgi:MFS family permease